MVVEVGAAPRPGEGHYAARVCRAPGVEDLDFLRLRRPAPVAGAEALCDAPVGEAGGIGSVRILTDDREVAVRLSGEARVWVDADVVGGAEPERNLVEARLPGVRVDHLDHVRVRVDRVDQLRPRQVLRRSGRACGRVGLVRDEIAPHLRIAGHAGNGAPERGIGLFKRAARVVVVPDPHERLRSSRKRIGGVSIAHVVEVPAVVGHARIGDSARSAVVEVALGIGAARRWRRRRRRRRGWRRCRYPQCQELAQFAARVIGRPRRPFAGGSRSCLDVRRAFGIEIPAPDRVADVELLGHHGRRSDRLARAGAEEADDRVACRRRRDRRSDDRRAPGRKRAAVRIDRRRRIDVLEVDDGSSRRHLRSKRPAVARGLG